MKLLTDKELIEAIDKPIFHKISEVADALHLDCYVIGGYVRDLFLERPSNDIDVVVVSGTDAGEPTGGDEKATEHTASRPGIVIAEHLKQVLGKKASIAVFRNFGTAQLKYDGMEVEFVGARRESYDRGSRKPVVEDGTLEDDQNRRDFTINAMAICLNEARYGELLDPFDGQYDMQDCTIRTAGGMAREDRFFYFNKDSLLVTNLTERMSLNIAVTDAFPRSSVPFLCCWVTAVLLVTLVLFPLMFLAEPTLC